MSFSQERTAKRRVHNIFFSPDPGNLQHLIFRDWPLSGEFCYFERLPMFWNFASTEDFTSWRHLHKKQSMIIFTLNKLADATGPENDANV